MSANYLPTFIIQIYVTGVAKTCIVHTPKFLTLVTHKNLLGLTDSYETFRDCRTNIPLSLLKISNLYIISCAVYGSSNVEYQMCELCTFSKI